MAENWDDFTPTDMNTTGDSTDKSKDRVTIWHYNGLGQVTNLVAYDRNADGSVTSNDNKIITNA